MQPRPSRLWLTVAAVTIAGAAADAAAQDARITVAMHYTQEQIAPLEACFRAYEQEHPGTEIVYQQLSYRDYLQTVLTSRIAGQAPDVYHLYSIWGAQMVDNGVLAEPPQGIAQFVRDAYAPATVDAATIDGQLWGVPTEVSVYMLVYNRQLLAEAGYDAPPKTFDELREMAAKITETNEQGNVTTAGFAFADSTAGVVHPFLAQLYSQGEELFSEDFTAANLTSDAAVAVLEQQAALFEQGITQKSVDAFDFPAGGIAMMIMANWFEQTLRDGFGEAFADTVGVAPIPAGDDWKTLQYAFFFGVDSNSDVQEQAWDLIGYLNGAEEPGKLSCAGEMLVELGALTANRNDIAAAKAELDDVFTAPFVQALRDGRAITEPNVIQAAEIERLLAAEIEAAWAGDKAPAAALADADAEIEDILAEFY